MATRTGSRKNVVKALRLAGEIARSERRLDAAEADLRQSRDIAAALRNPVQHWKSELALGTFLQETGRDVEAQLAFGAADAVMRRVRLALREERLRQVFERHPDVLALQRLLVVT
jgi:hypothetical protein